MADAEGGHAHRRLYKTIRSGKESKVRRSPQAVACRKRGVQALGRPHTFLPRETTRYGLQLLRHGRGNPETDQGWNLRIDTDQGVRQAVQTWRQACPTYASGESSRAEYSAVEKVHDMGKDSTEARRPERTRIPDRSDRKPMSQPPCGL